MSAPIENVVAEIVTVACQQADRAEPDVAALLEAAGRSADQWHAVVLARSELRAVGLEQSADLALVVALGILDLAIADLGDQIRHARADAEHRLLRGGGAAA